MNTILGFQREVINTAKRLITEAVGEMLDVDSFVSSHTFRIADLGCSVGPNTFLAVQNIIEAVQFKHQCQGLHYQLPEFQVLFNDHTLNDFNTLFSSLPPDRIYYAAGVPGSFYSRLFPNASLHFVHSSYAIHWLSKVPKSVVDKSSPAWNKGRIHYSNSEVEVVKAYEAQYAEDMECFLNARAQEVGIIGEEKVDSFNLPMYFMSPKELETAVDRNGYFSIERMEDLPPITELRIGTHPIGQIVKVNLRAVLGGVIKAHFGDVILDELFDSFGIKFEEGFQMIMSGGNLNFFALLRRKAMD
ncbi:loganic acid O-methyltransferase-like [Fagus crenata]